MELDKHIASISLQTLIVVHWIVEERFRRKLDKDGFSKVYIRKARYFRRFYVFQDRR